MAVEFSGTLVVPTIQYGNLQPAFSVQADTLEEARNLWLQEARRLYRAVGKDFDLDDTVEAAPSQPAGRVVKCVATGTEVVFDADRHLYDGGNSGWLSGSAFAKKFQRDFPASHIAAQIAAKHDVDASAVLDWWSKNAEIASSYGTSVHAAIEAYGKYSELARVTKGDADAALPKNPHVREAVVKFFEAHPNEDAIYEAFVADPVMKHCGFIDRLRLTGEKRGYVTDYKTNADITKTVKVLPPFSDKVENTPLGVFSLQLSFYSHCLMRYGWEIEGIIVHHWDGRNWVDYEREVVDVTQAF